MRYTKAALLLFGLGLVLGFVVVVGEFSHLEWVASALMALALVLLPVTLFADGHGMALLGWIAARLAREKRPKSRRRSRPAGARRKPPARNATRRRRT
jgi:hypothetical protein